jgi:hypothetical protein
LRDSEALSATARHQEHSNSRNRPLFPRLHKPFSKPIAQAALREQVLQRRVLLKKQ